MKTLKSRLQKKIEPGYLVQGEDVLLYDKALEMIKKSTGLSLEDFNFVTFDDDSFNAEAVIDACGVLPIASERRIVLLKNISSFTDSFKKKLTEYLKNPCPTTVLVVFDFWNKFDFMICEKVSAKRLDDQTLKEIVQKTLDECGKSITVDACQKLIEACCNYYSLLSGELEKLKMSNVFQITEKTIDEMVCKQTEFTVFELTDALSRRDADKAVSLLSLMPKDIKTFALVQNHFRRLFFVAISDLDNKTLASLLSVKEFAIVKSRELSKNFSKLQLKNIYEMLSDVDFYIKNGQMQIENALFYLIFGILYC